MLSVNHGLKSRTILGKTVETYHSDKSPKLATTQYQSLKSRVMPQFRSLTEKILFQYRVNALMHDANTRLEIKGRRR